LLGGEGREDIFKPTIRNESLHETGNDNGIKVVNFATSRIQCSHIAKFINTLGLLLSKNIKNKIYKTIILFVVSHGCEILSLTLMEEHKLRVFLNVVLN
jgi:hypothetical protein